MAMVFPMTAEGAHRFLIVAGCFADAAPAIRLAALLAQARQPAGALVGVLVRETTLEAAEGAPLLSRPRMNRSLPPPALSREALSAAYAADARAFSARLSLIATRARLPWAFRTDQGMSADLACQLRQPGDIVLLGYRRLLDTGGPVVALCPDDDHHTRSFASALARALHCRALSLPVEAADRPAMIDEMSASALIVAPVLAHQPARLSALIEAARCPVLVAPDTA